MFEECGFIEKYGSGIRRIKKLCYEQGIIKPKFKEFQKDFKVTVFKKNLKKIIVVLKQDGLLTREDLAHIVGASANVVKQHLSKLKIGNKIKKVDSTKAGYWEVLDVR